MTETNGNGDLKKVPNRSRRKEREELKNGLPGLPGERKVAPLDFDDVQVVFSDRKAVVVDGFEVGSELTYEVRVNGEKVADLSASVITGELDFLGYIESLSKMVHARIIGRFRRRGR